MAHLYVTHVSLVVVVVAVLVLFLFVCSCYCCCCCCEVAHQEDIAMHVCVSELFENEECCAIITSLLSDYS